MRKATWGALLLGVDALAFGWPVRSSPVHGLVSLAGLAGYLLLFVDPPVASPRQRQFMVAGIVCSLAGFILIVSSAPFPFILVARLLAVAGISLPLWLVAQPPRYAFVVAGVLALLGLVTADIYATSSHAYVASAGALWVAWLLHHPLSIPGPKKPARVVTARDVVFLSPEEKAERLAALEKRFKAGEIPEHKYWDKRQEIESR